MMNIYNPWADLPEMPDKDEQGNPLSDEDREALAFQTAAFGCASYVMALVIGLLLCWLLGSCTTTKYVPVVEHKTDTLRQTVTQRDSIHVHDSIRISEKGDTVRIERWHTAWRDREVHDTTYVARHDSIPVPYEVIKEVPRERTTTEWVLLAVGLLSLIAVIVWIASKVKRFLLGI